MAASEVDSLGAQDVSRQGKSVEVDEY
jgi:hypothetical protein